MAAIPGHLVPVQLGPPLANQYESFVLEACWDGIPPSDAEARKRWDWSKQQCWRQLHRFVDRQVLVDGRQAALVEHASCQRLFIVIKARLHHKHFARQLKTEFEQCCPDIALSADHPVAPLDRVHVRTLLSWGDPMADEIHVRKAAMEHPDTNDLARTRPDLVIAVRQLCKQLTEDGGGTPGYGLHEVEPEDLTVEDWDKVLPEQIPPQKCILNLCEEVKELVAIEPEKASVAQSTALVSNAAQSTALVSNAAQSTVCMLLDTSQALTVLTEIGRQNDGRGGYHQDKNDLEKEFQDHSYSLEHHFRQPVHELDKLKRDHESALASLEKREARRTRAEQLAEEFKVPAQYSGQSRTLLFYQTDKLQNFIVLDRKLVPQEHKVRLLLEECGSNAELSRVAAMYHRLFKMDKENSSEKNQSQNRDCCLQIYARHFQTDDARRIRAVGPQMRFLPPDLMEMFELGWYGPARTGVRRCLGCRKQFESDVRCYCSEQCMEHTSKPACRTCKKPFDYKCRGCGHVNDPDWIWCSKCSAQLYILDFAPWGSEWVPQCATCDLLPWSQRFLAKGYTAADLSKINRQCTRLERLLALMPDAGAHATAMRVGGRFADMSEFLIKLCANFNRAKAPEREELMKSINEVRQATLPYVNEANKRTFDKRYDPIVLPDAKRRKL